VIDGAERLSANVHCAVIAAFVGVDSSELTHAISVLNLASVREREARISK
jgi:hypothetical protein